MTHDIFNIRENLVIKIENGFIVRLLLVRISSLIFIFTIPGTTTAR
jgi:hypothetical protein